MGLILTLIIGGIAGWIASMVMHTDAAQGTLMDIVLGIVGSFVGSFIMNALGQSGVTGFNLYSLLVSVLGAVVVIYIGRMFLSKRT